MFCLRRLKALVCQNALSSPFQDLPTSSLRGEAPVSFTALYPTAAVLNHNCQPNATAMFLGGDPQAGAARDGTSGSNSRSNSVRGCSTGVGPRLLLHATAPIFPGEEITVDYLAGEGGSLLPIDTRQRLLKRRWGFICR
jgi:hypothetical protein